MRATITRVAAGVGPDFTNTKTYLSRESLLKWGVAPAIMRLGGGVCMVDVLDDTGKRIESFSMDRWGEV